MKGFDIYRYTVDTPRGYFWRGHALIRKDQVTPDENRCRSRRSISVNRFVRTKRRALNIIHAHPGCELGLLLRRSPRKDRKRAHMKQGKN